MAKMKNTAVLVLAITACVAAIAQSAAVSRVQSRRRWRTSDDDAGQIVSKWLPSLAARNAFHPFPAPDSPQERYALSPKRKQVLAK